MSIEVQDGALIVKDPSDSAVLVFDWNAFNLGAGAAISTSTWTLTGLRGDTTTTPVTKDNETVVTGSSNRKTQVRLLAGAAGSLWRLDNKIVTDETPSQQKERSILIKVESR